MASVTTPVKVTQTVTSDSCQGYCAICAQDIQLKHKNPKDLTINLWRNDNKTDHCKVVEDFLAKSFSRDSELRVVCKSCFRGAQSKGSKGSPTGVNEEGDRIIAPLQACKKRSAVRNSSC